MSVIAGISVVIPNYNGQVLLPQILPTVLTALQNIGLASEIVVVDDCSTDQSLALLSRQFPTIEVVSNDVNSGFSVTANKGIRAAKYEWVLLLNSDVKLERNYFQPLLKYTQQQEVFGVMGRIIGWHDEGIQDGAKYPSFQGVKIKTSGNYILRDDEVPKHGLFTMYLSGANAFMRKEVFLKIGGFNELFSPFYVEDFELSLRAWRLGYVCCYEHEAVCRHQTSTTIARGNRKEKIRTIYNRNKMFLHAIHLEGGTRILWFVQLVFESMLQILLFKKYYLQALSLFVAGYNSVRVSRVNLQRLAGNRRLLNVNEVVDRIKLSIAGKDIIRF